MNSGDEQVREIIAQQAGEWFVAHRAGALDATERRAFDAWLATSPVHVEEYLGIALLARHLPAAADDPDVALEMLLHRARQADATSEPAFRTSSAPVRAATDRKRSVRRWYWAAASVTAMLAVVGTFLWWSAERPVVERYATRHGELRTASLSDGSTLHLNTDTVLTVRYSRAERLVQIDHGEVLFEVAHEPRRAFRVLAGTADVVAVGTTFDVYRETNDTLVTVVQGRVAVRASDVGGGTVSVGAGEQVRVGPGTAPARAKPVAVERSTAWLRRQIVFEEEPLGKVAVEFNRYSATPIDIETPELRSKQISGVFSADDTESLVAFLRSLDGVRVEVTPTKIRVSRR
jgi:transmembrane sensor